MSFDPSLVSVSVLTTYLSSHSSPEDNQYTFAYTITISNDSELPVQLLSRHWIITDADNDEPMEIDPSELPTFEVPVRLFSLHTPTALN